MTDETLGSERRLAPDFPSPPFTLRRYAALSLLGTGGFGSVYLAQDLALDRAVALKLVAAEGEEIPEEGRLLARSNHPHIVTLHDVGRWEGFAFLVMEIMTGGTLAERLRRGPLPVEAVVRWLLQAAMGLGAAHAREVAHRDVKPSNLLLGLGDVLKVGDFGLAHGGVASGLGGAARLHGGTLPYMSPEAVGPVGTGASLEAGIALDLYALGITAFELLAGRRPFEGDDAQIIAHHTGTRVDVDGLAAAGAPPLLRALIRQLLSKHPADRPQSMGEVEDLLAGVLGGLARGRGSHPPGPSPIQDPGAGSQAPHALHRIHVQLSHELGNLAGFFRRAGGPSTLDEVFVELSLGPWAGDARGEIEPLMEEGLLRLRQGEALRLREVIDLPRRRWVLLGDPGSGKTTLLHQLSQALIAETREGDGDRTPLYFKVSELGRGWGLRRAVSACYGEEQVEAVLRAAAQGALVLLLDGLDEAVDPAAARSAIAGMGADAPACQLVVTSRYAGYQDHPLAASFLPLALLPLGADGQRRLLGAWGIPEPTIAATLAHLNARHRLRPLVETPLLLTLVALLLRERPDVTLPSRRGELYRMAVSQLLLREFSPNVPGKPGAARRLRSPDVAEEALGVIALALHGEEGSAYPMAEIRRVLCAHPDLMENIRAEWGGLLPFLEEVADCTGLLEKDRAGASAAPVWRSPHRTFREYLAARALMAAIERQGLEDVPEAVLQGAGRETRAPSEERRAGGALGVVLTAAAKQPELWSEVLAQTCGLMAPVEADLLVRWVALMGSPELVLRVVAEAENIREDTVWAVLRLDLAGGWKARMEVLEQLPSLVRNGSAMIRLVDRYLKRTTDGNDLYFARELLNKLAIGDVEADGAFILTEGCRAQAAALAAEVLRRHRPEAREEVRAILEEEWISIEGGCFRMGSEDGRDNEKPVREVTLSAYRLQKVPVTNALYERFDPGHRQERSFADRVKDSEELDRHPVVGVTWYEARMFAEWAGSSLPTEAQWEYGARGPDGAYRRGREYPWGGGEPTEKLANFNHNVGHTTPVGTYPDGASWCSALDMAGNVWEWCADWDGSYDPAQALNPTGPPSGSFRVLRGGSWVNGAGGLRGADRIGDWPGRRGRNFGFRLAAPLLGNDDSDSD